MRDPSSDFQGPIADRPLSRASRWLPRSSVNGVLSAKPVTATRLADDIVTLSDDEAAQGAGNPSLASIGGPDRIVLDDRYLKVPLLVAARRMKEDRLHDAEPAHRTRLS